MTASTYRAIQVTEPRKLELVQRPVTDPPPGKVRIRVEACGVCHSDAATVEGGVFPGMNYPRVPGHEAVGKIDAVGKGVLDWKVGQRVGVGQRQPFSGIHYDGGYAEVMIASQSGLAAIPTELSSADAAPLLCAGLTTYNALRNSPARPGDLVAVQGIGGLGHLGVQFAARMGFRERSRLTP